MWIREVLPRAPSSMTLFVAPSRCATVMISDAFFAQFDAIDDTPTPLPVSPRQSLYPDDLTFLDEALHAAFHDMPHAAPDRGGVSWTISTPHGIVELTPPSDLVPAAGSTSAELPAAWPGSGEAQVGHPNPGSGNAQLRLARETRASTTPPGPRRTIWARCIRSVDWASDRALAALGRNQVFVIQGDVDSPTVLLMGTLTKNGAN